jgi:UPF0176 protein
MLHNKINRRELKEKLYKETFERITLSFYKYIYINDTQIFRDEVYQKLHELNCFGRIYIAHEGINAQMSVPAAQYQVFLDWINTNNYLTNVPIKTAVDDNGKSFFVLDVKIKNKLVADGLPDHTYDVTNVGAHLSAQAFNDAMAQHGTIVVDMRNNYESEIGHFENAICPDADTFKEELPKTLEILKNKENQKILLYCTGGIRCEKASAYLKHHGFVDVNQLHGGIIAYAQQVQAQSLENKFVGKNFVFDERMGETITDQVISACHQCAAPANTHRNCANDYCHILFIQCQTCADAYSQCCSVQCHQFTQQTPEIQAATYKNYKFSGTKDTNKRVRPRLTR